MQLVDDSELEASPSTPSDPFGATSPFYGGGVRVPTMLQRIVILLALLTAPAFAADPDWHRPFARYINSPAYLNEVGSNIALLEQHLAPDCVQVLQGMERLELRIVEQPIFLPGLPIPQAGQWREQVEIDRCGEAEIHNVLVTATNGSTPFMTVLLPGTSKADGKLQLDASPAAFAIAGVRAGKSCTDQERQIVRAEFRGWLDGTGSAPLDQRRWREIWAVRLCGQTVDVQIDFQPDGRGGYTHAANLPQSGR